MRRLAAVVFLLLATPLTAEPHALRGPSSEILGNPAQTALAVGMPGLFLSHTLETGFSVELEARFSYDGIPTVSSLTAWAGQSWMLAQNDAGWGIEARLAGGLILPTVRPGLALGGLALIRGGYFGPTFQFWGGFNTAMEVGLIPQLDLSLAPKLDAGLAVRLEPVWLFAVAGFGLKWLPGFFPSFDYSLVGGVAWAWGWQNFSEAEAQSAE